MFWKIGVMRGLLVIAMTLGFVSVVQADTRIDASTFVNGPGFCDDGDHVVPAGERLTIAGGSESSFSAFCNVELGEGATFVIDRAILDLTVSK